MSASDEDEDKYDNIPSKEKKFRPDSCGDTNITTFDTANQEDKGNGMRIITSVTIDNSQQSSPVILFEQSRESSAFEDTPNRAVAITTTKVQCIGSKVKFEIQEVLQPDNAGIRSTFVFHSQHGGPAEDCFQNQFERTFTLDDDTSIVRSEILDVPNQETNQQTQKQTYKFNIGELDKGAKKTLRYVLPSGAHGAASQRAETGALVACRKSCCGENYTDIALPGGSSNPVPTSSFWPQDQKHSKHLSFSSEALLWDAPPPLEFADTKSDELEGLTKDLANFQIGGRDHRDYSPPPSEKNYKKDSGCPYSLREGEEGAHFSLFDHSSESDQYEPCMSVGPSSSVSRSSFTKDFIHSQEGATWRRNNSIGIVDHQPCCSATYLHKPMKRRRTFPGVSDGNAIPEDLPSCRSSFSSDTIPAYVLQSLPDQVAGRGELYQHGDRLGHYSLEGRKSSQGSCSHRRDSCNSNVHLERQQLSDTPILLMYERSHPDNSCPQQEQCPGHRQTPPEDKEQPEVDLAGNLSENMAEQRISVRDLVAKKEGEIRHEEAMMLNPVATVEENPHGDLLIQVIPPSRATSEDHILDNTSTRSLSITLEEDVNAPRCGRRSSIVTIVIGGGTAASQKVPVDAKPAVDSPREKQPPETLNELSETQSSTSTVVDGESTVVDGESMVVDGESMVVDGGLTIVDGGLTIVDTESSIVDTESSIVGGKSSGAHDVIEDPQPSTSSALPPTSAESSTSPPKTEEKKDSSVAVPGPSILEKPGGSSILEKPGGPRALEKASFHQPDSEKPSTSNFLEPVSELSSSVPDHWAKRRKLFKDSRQCSAGNTSITSDITEESVSEQSGSFDATGGVEDKGFYTETYHSAAWIYRGDEPMTISSPSGHRPRTRPATIRERTIKICKGVGDYPWGFRIQFSKPIVVTEVDTNGPAEEAGLIVGDYVMAVNGIDVTNVPHSEAAELAKQGPDLLTLTIGSNISRGPNTPRPACRGYLHKRTQSGLIKGWRKRWFVLRHDYCLYYYRHKRDEGRRPALSYIKLDGADVGVDSTLGRPFVFKCRPLAANRVYFYCATSSQEMKRWTEAMERAVQPVTQRHVWVDVTRHNANLPPLAVKNPECLGLLHQLDGNKDVWVQRYCILKDGCLYFYAGIRSTHALGGIYLHGYTVRETPLGSKKSTIELKPPSDEFKTFHISAENPAENQRWILAIRASINKWLPLHQHYNRTPEETKM